MDSHAFRREKIYGDDHTREKEFTNLRKRERDVKQSPDLSLRDIAANDRFYRQKTGRFDEFTLSGVEALSARFFRGL